MFFWGNCPSWPLQSDRRVTHLCTWVERGGEIIWEEKKWGRSFFFIFSFPTLLHACYIGCGPLDLESSRSQRPNIPVRPPHLPTKIIKMKNIQSFRKKRTTEDNSKQYFHQLWTRLIKILDAKCSLFTIYRIHFFLYYMPLSRNFQFNSSPRKTVYYLSFKHGAEEQNVYRRKADLGRLIKARCNNWTLR